MIDKETVLDAGAPVVRDSLVSAAPDAMPETVDDDGPLAWEGRVFAASVVWAFPGTMLGMLLCLFCPSEIHVASMVGGGLLFALFGGLMEAGHLFGG
jgi:hypothetical protein